MAILRPFNAVRPASSYIQAVQSPPYDVIDSYEAKNMAINNPYSFLHVDKSEIDVMVSENTNSDSVYEKARENLNFMLANNILIREKEAYFYIYKQIFRDQVQIGIVGCTSIDDYLNNIIKKHEQVLYDKENDRIKHMEYCNSNTSPVFLMYQGRTNINEIVNKWMNENKPIYNFDSDDNVNQVIWAINDVDTIHKLQVAFNEVNCLYIADGHHRASAAVKIGLSKRNQFPGYNSSDEFNYFLSVIFPQEHLRILEYNRVVKDLNNHTKETFIEKISEKFHVTLYDKEGPYHPHSKHTFGMFLMDQWYILTVKPGTFNSNNFVESLDVYILQNNLLAPILNIVDPRTSDRIEFIGGIRGLQELEKRVHNSSMGVAFSLCPLTAADIVKVSNDNKTMPPKATWFEPKLRSGIFLHQF